MLYFPYSSVTFSVISLFGASWSIRIFTVILILGPLFLATRTIIYNRNGQGEEEKKRKNEKYNKIQ